MHSSKRRANSFTISPAFKFLALLFAGIMACLLFSAPRKAEAVGKAECVVELTTGRVLHESNADAKLPMASTTKIMTALIVIEDCELDDVFTVDDGAVGVEGSSIYLKRGERISVRDALYGLMLRSGNDAARALALHHSGSLSGFVGRMNERAAQIGAVGTHFENPDGLPAEGHCSTAADMCAITKEAMKNAVFAGIVAAKSYTGQFRSFVNKNKLLSLVDGANGVKTGYTLKAGRCLVSSAQRQGMQVICTVLNCPDMYERSAELIEKAFENFALVELTGDKVFMCGGVPCSLSKNYKLLIERGQKMTIKCVPTCADRDIARGDVAGKLEIYASKDLIFGAHLYSIVNRKR